MNSLLFRSMFDDEGRRHITTITTKGLRAKVFGPDTNCFKKDVCDPDTNFYLKKLEVIDHAERLDRLHEFLCPTNVSADQFQNETEKIREAVLANEQISNLFKGVCLPIIIPHNIAGITDVGTLLEALLEAVGRSYKQEFPDREFYNYLKSILSNTIKIVESSRHQKLLDKIEQEPVFGWYCPGPLQGVSIDAQYKQMTNLPENLILSGLDAVIGQIMYPDVLAKNFNTPGYHLSAFYWKSRLYSLTFKAYEFELNFLDTGNLSYANDIYSGGLLVW